MFLLHSPKYVRFAYILIFASFAHLRFIQTLTGRGDELVLAPTIKLPQLFSLDSAQAAWSPDRSSLWAGLFDLRDTLLDHGVGFNFDCFYHYLYTGNLDDLWEPYPRLQRFIKYLESIVGTDGLLPVENIGIPSVWIDHIAFHDRVVQVHGAPD